MTTEDLSSDLSKRMQDMMYGTPGRALANGGRGTCYPAPHAVSRLSQHHNRHMFSPQPTG